MRIAVVTETFYPFKGGSAKRYYEVFRRIVREGHDVVLFTTRLAKEWPEQENIDGIEVRRSPMVLRRLHNQWRLSVGYSSREVWHLEQFRYTPWGGYAYVGIGLEMLTAKVPDITITVSELTVRKLVNLQAQRRR